MTIVTFARPLAAPPTDHSADGKPAAIEVKMSRDIPLPTPRSVMSSPSHMMRPVPAVIVMIIRTMVTHESFGMSGTGQPGMRFPLRAIVIIVVDCRTARKMVR